VIASQPDEERPTTLGLALLGLLHAHPRSGYALRKVFEDTPIGRFSSSPGSIYPALKRLQAAGLLSRRAADGASATFHLSARGREVLLTWLRAPVDVTEYDREPDVTLLRFAFLDAVGNPALTGHYLRSFQHAVRQSLASLRSYLRSEPGLALTVHGRLAVQHGISTRQAALRWARRALDELADPGHTTP
jgi:DNA-binding PadR family transcriptional regulator